MFAFNRLLAFTTLISVVGVQCAPKTLISGDAPFADPVELDVSLTEIDTIINTADVVSQKGGATTDAPPNLPPLDTVVTAVDGDVTEAGSNSTTHDLRRRSLHPAVPGRLSRAAASKRAERYTQVFEGTGTGSEDRDCSIEGIGYLTYTVVSNATYSVDDCLAFCDRVPGCTYANLYYEYNNPLLDWVFSEKSNLKCAVYGDVHGAAEKTNCGGQQLAPEGWGKTYIQQSTGYALHKSIADPSVPEGYEPVFGPVNGANNAPGYMGFVFLSSYDVDACAAECNKRGPDGNGGACQYFNIWRALVNGIPTTYTCSMYYLPSDTSTAVNYGQGDLKVTYSRGYARKSLVSDGGFESYTCPNGGSFCYTANTEHWTGISPYPSARNAVIFHYNPYAHSGDSVGILGSVDGTNAESGTLTPSAGSLATVAGKEYTIHFFHSSSFNEPEFQKETFVDVIWNGEIVETIRPGYSTWKYYEFKVTAKGGDVLEFHGGKFPAYSFIDDVFVFAA